MKRFIEKAIKKNLNEAIIEKDFWVCFLLKILFYESQYRSYFSFKGGTSLSKGYAVIERFSEDIDLIMDWRLLGYSENEPWEERSNRQQDLFNKELGIRTEQFVRIALLPELETTLRKFLSESFELCVDEADSQTICFVYPQLFKGKSLVQEIRLEVGALATCYN